VRSGATVRRAVVGCAAALVMVVGTAACGDDAPRADPASGGTEGGGSGSGPDPTFSRVEADAALLPPIDSPDPLPPNDAAALARQYAPLLDELGLRLTRGALIDRSDGGYVVSDEGTHLALYVEPVGDDHTAEQYLDGLWHLSAVLTPDVFARYTDVVSYDICQEPLPDVDPRPEPFPVTQVEVTREGSAAMDWAGGSLVDLLAASQRTGGGVLVRVDDTIDSLPDYTDALEQATDLVGAGGGG
jgi:hypothetical protein